jgi:5'-methylthioadenosine phosphorylase
MGRLAVVLGSSATGSRFERLRALVGEHGGVALQRHGGEGYTLPHEIDHEANLRSLMESGCDRVLAVGSVGSLREEIGVGSIVCPDDFIALQLRLTTLDDASAHTAPGFDPRWRAALLSASAAAGAGVEDGGVYWQTTGPRFETPAEVRLLAAHAHLVGMTLASECIVAGELRLPYAAICVVDNLANGIGPGPLAVEELERDRDANVAKLDECLGSLLAELGR